METLFNSEPVGVFTLPWIWDMETRIEAAGEASS
jgi:hypothetical protein